MDWIDSFQLYLFDLDGLLVNSEMIHYQAYIDMLDRRGFKLNWSFLKFCEVAHFSDVSLKEGLYSFFPSLYNQEPNFNILRKEKNEIFLKLLSSSKVDLMNGVKKLLEELDKKNIKRCVVTNSSNIMCDIIKSKQPTLKTIPNWITRLDYINPKPDPECYNKAITLFAKKGDRIIGFEDSTRGLNALLKTTATAVLINPKEDILSQGIRSNKVYHYKSIDLMLKEKNI
ncbi:MAG: Beta-phosphoglucomutase [Candidatus Anoxychlamydiales bacterium]|nr:Beta-phosphoglucomutase [Candidatus Anoxychlamydiales bacterium]